MKTLPEKWVRRAAVWLVCGQIALSLLAERSFALTVYGDTAQGLLLLFGAWMMWSNSSHAQGQRRLFWALMGAGFVLWLLSQAMWTYYEVLAHQEVPNPFVADVVIFIHLVPMMAALTLQVESSRGKGLLGSVDVLALLFWWVYLYLFVVIPWQFVHFDLQNYGRSFNLLYLLEHGVFLLGVGALWWRSYDRWKKIHGHIFGAAFLYAISAYAAGIAIDLHRYYTGSSFDIPLTMSEAWFVWVGVLASEIPPQQEAPVQVEGFGLSVWSGRIAMLATLSIPCMGLWAALAPGQPLMVRNFRLMVTLGAVLVLGSLAFFKQHLLNGELQRLLREAEASLDHLRRMQAQLLQAEKLASLGQLVAGAAHEINNPLTAILGYTDLLAETTELTPEQRSLAEQILQQSRRTKDLVASLLNFARPAPASKQPLDVNAVLQTALKLSQERLHAQNILVSLQLGHSLPHVSADRNQILQVFLHVVRNALEAMESCPHGTLTVSTRAQNGSVLVQFSDSGPGIADLNRIFDPFYTTKPVGHGTGLGLSACYGILGEHGGTIRCENLSRGGAKFEIELPALDATPGDTPETVSTAIA